MSNSAKRLAIDPLSVAGVSGAPYPKPFEEPLKGSVLRRLGGAFKLERLAVGMVELEPGAWLSQRLWQTDEDEFFYVLEGTATLVSDEGEEDMPVGTCVGFRAGDANGHHFMNKSLAPVMLLEMANTADGINTTFYPDARMRAEWQNGRRIYIRENEPA